MLASEAEDKKTVTLTAPGFEDVASKLHEWSRWCREFLNWEQARIVAGEPTEKEKAEHKRALTWLLRLTRMIHSLIADPEFPDRALARELEGRVWQLEQSWRMIYEPMDEEEAERLLKKTFTTLEDQKLIQQLFPG
jgi:hypothetical protein